MKITMNSFMLSTKAQAHRLLTHFYTYNNQVTRWFFQKMCIITIALNIYLIKSFVCQT